MTFLAAGWLLLLLPLAAVAWVVCRRIAVPASTTAAWLWRRGPTESTRPREKSAWPPLWVLAAIASAAFAIVALAGFATEPHRAEIVVVADPASRLAAGNGRSPLAMMFARVRAAAGPANLRIVVPGQPEAHAIDEVRPTARATGDALMATVWRLAREGRTIVVLTDQVAVTGGPKRIVVRPRPHDSPATVTMAARDVSGATSLFLRADISPRDKLSVKVRSGDETAVAQLVKADGGAFATASATLDRAGDRIVATFDDGRVAARLARDGRTRIRLARAGALPAFADRFAVIYARERPAAAGATGVTLSIEDDPGNGPRVVVATGAAMNDASAARRASHPVVDAIGEELRTLAPIDALPPRGFEPIAWRGERPMVAVREGAGARGVWIGIDATRPTPALVSLLDEAVRWAAGDSGYAWSAVTSDDVPRDGWTPVDVDDRSVDASPGFYRDADGREHAVNATPAPATIADGSPPDDALGAFISNVMTEAGGTSSRVPAALAAAAAGLAATLCGFASRPRRSS